jgi:hypothetical protein
MASPWMPVTVLLLLAGRAPSQPGGRPAPRDSDAHSERSSLKARQETTMPWSGPFVRS